MRYNRCQTKEQCVPCMKGNKVDKKWSQRSDPAIGFFGCTMFNTPFNLGIYITSFTKNTPNRKPKTEIIQSKFE